MLDHLLSAWYPFSWKFYSHTFRVNSRKKKSVKHSTTHKGLYKSYLRNDQHQKQKEGENYSVYGIKRTERQEMQWNRNSTRSWASTGNVTHSSSMPPVRACNADEDSERTPVLTLWGRHLSYETAGHPNRQGPCSAKAILHSFVITVFVY